MPTIPFALQWSIPENQLLPLKDSANGSLCSRTVLKLREFDYYLQIYPNGDKDERRGETRIYLHLKLKNVRKVDAAFTFIIATANRSYDLQYVYEKTIGWGCYICKTDELFDPEKKYIVDGKFTVKVNGIFKFGDAFPFAAIEQQKWQGGNLGDETWKKEDTKDFTILVEEKEIKVHKFILGVRSEVFTAMLNSNMKESKENKAVITDFPFTVVEAAFKIIYDCNFTTSLSLDELMLLLQFFDKYQLTALKDKVENLLIGQISALTVCCITNGLTLTNSPKLKEKCMEFLSASFAAKTSLSDFKTLDKDIVFEIVENSLYENVGAK